MNPPSVARPRSRRYLTAGLAVGGAVVAVALVSSSGTSAAVTPTSDDKLVATDARANLLGADPTLHRGDLVILSVRGFRPGAEVTGRLVGAVPDLTVPPAGADGATRLVYRVPRTATPGRHIIALTGAPADDAGGSGTPVDGAGVMATVPNLGLFEFHVAG